MDAKPKPDADGNDGSKSASERVGKESRKMVRGELLGQHSHQTANGRSVHIWTRDGKYIARGYVNRRRFGESLGADAKEAAYRLRRLLVELEDGVYVRPTERSRRQIDRGSTPRSTVRQLVDDFLHDKRMTRGAKTAADYRSRLVPVVEFSERAATKQRWPLAQDADRDFALELKAFLHERKTSRNGRSSAREQSMSATQVRNVLDCARTLYNWGAKPAFNKLPSFLANPIHQDIVGSKPQKDPLRRVLFPIATRVQLVEQMDLWQLTQFAIAFVLPLRPEDYTGLLISEVDFDSCEFRFGTRFQGRDFTKGRQSFISPFPEELAPLLRVCQGGRADGPLLRKRTVFDGRRRPANTGETTAEVISCIERAFIGAKPGVIVTAADQKKLIRNALLSLGGVSGDSLSKEFALLRKKCKPPVDARMYDLRGSINTELNAAGVTHLDQRYLTGHGTRDILNEYVSLDPRGQMPKYFRAIQPLLSAITNRGREIGIKC